MLVNGDRPPLKVFDVPPPIGKLRIKSCLLEEAVTVIAVVDPCFIVIKGPEERKVEFYP